MHWQVYFGDERCLPADDAGRNSRMAADAWVDHVSIPQDQVHAIPTELGAAAAVFAYPETLRGEAVDDGTHRMWARSPVAPKKTKASELDIVISIRPLRPRRRNRRSIQAQRSSD